MWFKGKGRLAVGLRERKKAKTRKTISDLATRLFIERGYDNVTVAEIAEIAEVAVTTLFNYFPTKESLIFDESHDREEALVNAVHTRVKGTSILDALQAHFLRLLPMSQRNTKEHEDIIRLIRSTPDLAREHRELWRRSEQSLAQAISKESEPKLSRIEAEMISHCVLDAFRRSIETSNPKPSLVSLFGILKDGWQQ
ncbi:TetR/AcrR family transcriptional regulator [Granulicella sp. S156]|uniref:TetR/AcrR family transcriptional regulator n=1 Tax=Granulicella sp. S156 TaxID=1747224 RepID=UPI0020B176A9|nr:TetR/AcrR family transcriptional regulator [Granulicella sp. S156]